MLMTVLVAVAPLAEPVRVEGGLVEGTVEDGITVYRGIPFAAPPVGDLRWRPPQPVESWEGVLRADSFAPACPQMQLNFPGFPQGEMSEDCLYLNIWTPAESPDAKLPVMVWIYGGGFALGSTSMPTYNGAEISKKGVILVSVAYRVGPLGFLVHPELTAESENKTSGNYGLMDQIAGLEWVQRNIAAFGGDPDRVTIFGESAGGISVSMLAASPRTKGLFHGAISESGASFAPARTAREEDSMQLLAGAEAAGVEFAERMGASSLAELRALDPAAWEEDPAAQMGGFWPIIDGHAIADDQYVLYEEGMYNDVPVLIGTNSDEGSMFVRPTTPDQYVAGTRRRFGPFADRMLELYPAQTEAATHRALADIFRDAGFAWHTWAWARLQSETGKSKVFVYYFDQKQPASPFPMPFQSEGAPHGSEIGYVFKQLDPGRQWTDADRALSELMATYWTNFAKFGDPNGEGVPQWPVFEEGEPTVMYLTGTPHTGPLPNREQLEAMDEYFAWKRAPGT